MRGQVKVYQKKIIARRRKRAFFIVLYLFFIIGLSWCGLSFISGLQAFAITNVKVEGNQRLSESLVQNVIAEKADGTYASFFSKRNIFLYPKNAVRNEIASWPLVKSVEISREGLHTVVVSVKERTEDVFWCGGEIGDTSHCYSVDEEGLIFASVDVTASSTALIYRGLVTNEPIGTRLLLPEQFKRIQFFVQNLAGLSVNPHQVVLSDTGYMTVVMASGAQFIIRTSDDLSEVLSNIATVISNKSIAPTLAQFLDTLDYIKFDSPTKIVYKLRGSR